VVVKPIGSELGVREAAWIARNRAVVDRLSGGKVGYVYMSDMGELGLQQFVRQFYGQLGKQALIMDDRWNGGGFVAPMALERLRRVLVSLNVNRSGGVTTQPNDLLIGPKVALLNHWSGSDGDIFPDYFRKFGLGQLIGTRSWGGVRGIRGDWPLLDGGYITIPEAAEFTPQSQWSIENHGVDPDIVVEDMPADLLAGHDAQLETAVSVLLREIAGKPAGLPAAPPMLPPYPASGMVAPAP
jgi:tricorn protease